MNIVNIIKYRGASPTARLFKHIPRVKDGFIGIYRRIRVCCHGNVALYTQWCTTLFSDPDIWYVIETEDGGHVAGFGTINKGKAFLKRYE